MGLIVHPPEFIRLFFQNYTWKLPPQTPDKKILYLTFDDGPIPEMTIGTLDMLAQYNAKATFFCVGDNVRKYPDLYKRILIEGHRTGNHTFNHLKGTKTKVKDYIENVEKADKYIQSDLFRPPHGMLKKRQTKILVQTRHIILWDVLTKDYDKRISPQKCWQNVEENVSPGAIIVFHDNIKAMANQRYALKKTLETYSQQGYQFLGIPHFS